MYTHGEFVTAQFMESVLEISRDPAVGDVLGQRCTTIALGRTMCVRRFLLTGHDWLWFIDTDMAVGPDVLPAMLEKADCPAIIAVDCWRHDANLGSVSTLAHDGCGMACTLIHRRVFEDVEAAHRDDPWPWFGHDLVDGQRLSEDLTFCRRALAVGHEIIPVRSKIANHFKLQPLVPPGSKWTME